MEENQDADENKPLPRACPSDQLTGKVAAWPNLPNFTLRLKSGPQKYNKWLSKWNSFCHKRKDDQNPNANRKYLRKALSTKFAHKLETSRWNVSWKKNGTPVAKILECIRSCVFRKLERNGTHVRLYNSNHITKNSALPGFSQTSRPVKSCNEFSNKLSVKTADMVLSNQRHKNISQKLRMSLYDPINTQQTSFCKNISSNVSSISVLNSFGNVSLLNKKINHCLSIESKKKLQVENGKWKVNWPGFIMDYDSVTAESYNNWLANWKSFCTKNPFDEISENLQRQLLQSTLSRRFKWVLENESWNVSWKKNGTRVAMIMQYIHQCASKLSQLRIALNKRLETIGDGEDFIKEFVSVIDNSYNAKNISEKYRFMIKLLYYSAKYPYIKQKVMKLALRINPKKVCKDHWNRISNLFIKLFDEQQEKNKQEKHIDEIHGLESGSYTSCPLCDFRGCQCINSMALHIKRHELNTENICSWCKCEFSSKDQTLQHMVRVHEDSLSCSQCDYQTHYKLGDIYGDNSMIGTLHSLRFSLLSGESRNRKLYAATTNQNIASSVLRIKNGNANVIQKIGHRKSLSAKDISVLRLQLMSNTYCGDARVTCHFCEVKFLQKQFKKHIMVDHIDLKKVVCSLCDWTTFYNDQMQGHEQKHKKGQEKLCPHCPYVCVETQQLFIHKKTKHYVYNHISVI